MASEQTHTVQLNAAIINVTDSICVGCGENHMVIFVLKVACQFIAGVLSQSQTRMPLKVFSTMNH